MLNLATECAEDHRVPSQKPEPARLDNGSPTLSRLYADAPETSPAWERLTAGEQQLATRLNETLALTSVVLHHRSVPGSRISIDHLVVGPTGIWVISSKHDTGRVESRDRDSWSRAGDRLFIGGRNRTDVVTETESTIAAIRRSLEPIGYGGSPVNGAVCFPNATWPPMCPLFRLDGVWVGGDSELMPLLTGPPSFSDIAVDTVSHHLRSYLTTG